MPFPSDASGCLVAVAMCLAAGCAPSLPDPESPGARLYRERCGGCHRLYTPSTLTAAMWEMQLDRMQREMARRGVRPLAAAERETVLRYLRDHGADAAPTEAKG